MTVFTTSTLGWCSALAASSLGKDHSKYSTASRALLMFCTLKKESKKQIWKSHKNIWLSSFSECWSDLTLHSQGLKEFKGWISPGLQAHILLSETEKSHATKMGAAFWLCACRIFSRVRHDMLCQATVFKLPLIYFIFISNRGQVIWILILGGDVCVRCRTPRRALWCSYCNQLTCFAYQSRGFCCAQLF